MSVRGTLGKLGLVTEREVGAVITANLIRLTPNRSLVDSDWLAHFLTSRRFQDQLDNVSSQTTIKTIQIPALEAIEIDLPPLPEQRKIACILSTVDDLIQSTEALIAKYRAIKQGLMHDLLTRGVDASGRLRRPREEAPGLYKESAVGWVPSEWEVVSAESLGADKPYAIVDGLKVLKGSSAHFVNTELRPPGLYFAWQRGYGSLTIGERQRVAAIEYVQRQKEHHQKQTTNVWLERCDDEEG